MTTVIIVENNTPSFLIVDASSGSLVNETNDSILEVDNNDNMTLLTLMEQGPMGPIGNAEELPDLALIFEGALY